MRVPPSFKVPPVRSLVAHIGAVEVEGRALVTVSQDIAAPADRVWDVVADGWTYASWVVGASHIRDVDPAWPHVGTRLQHSVGSWPLMLRDYTEVLESVPRQRLVLRARAWPMGEAQVTISVEPAGDAQCRVTMEEHPVRGPAARLHNPVTEALLKARNIETLHRLQALAAGRP